jgi:hypothetical protein
MVSISSLGFEENVCSSWIYLMLNRSSYHLFFASRNDKAFSAT